MSYVTRYQMHNERLMILLSVEEKLVACKYTSLFALYLTPLPRVGNCFTTAKMRNLVKILP